MRTVPNRIRSTLLLTSLIALSACADAAGPRPAATPSSGLSAASGAIPVSACGTVLETPGAYVLAADLLGCPGYGVGIAGDSISLDLAGHRVSGAPGSAIGIFISTAAAGRNGYLTGVHVTGPGIIETFSAGLKLQEVRASRVEGVTVRLNLHGISVNRGQGTGKPSILDTLVNNVAIDNTAHGFTFNGARSTLFAGNVSTHNGFGIFGGHGFYLYMAERLVLRGNQADNNQGGGIYILPGQAANTIVGNEARGNGWVDLADQNSCGVNTWLGNTFATKSLPCIQ